MKIVLEFCNGPFAGRRIALRSSVRLTVGRTSRADIEVVSDDDLSAVHFELQVEPEGVFLRDLHSQYGTFVNDRPVKMAPLNDGDSVQAGQSLFRIIVEEPAIEIAPFFDPEASLTPISASAMSDPRWESRWESGHGLAQPHNIPRAFQAAYDDPSPAVIRGALQAAAWSRRTWLLSLCRHKCNDRRLNQLPFFEMLAVLGDAGDINRMQAIAASPEIGSQRFRVFGKFGHPQLLPLLIENMASNDLEDASAARLAFSKVVGRQLDVDLDTAYREATTFLKQNQARFSTATRWYGGVAVDSVKQLDELDQLDLESRFDAALRGHFHRAFEVPLTSLLNYQRSSPRIE